MKGQVDAGDEWSQKTLKDSDKLLIVSYRAHCSENYYGSDCTVKCVPKDGQFGHYTCDKNGNLVCLPGWTNTGAKKFCETREYINFYSRKPIHFVVYTYLYGAIKGRSLRQSSLATSVLSFACTLHMIRYESPSKRGALMKRERQQITVKIIDKRN